MEFIPKLCHNRTMEQMLLYITAHFAQDHFDYYTIYQEFFQLAKFVLMCNFTFLIKNCRMYILEKVNFIGKFMQASNH